MTIKRHPKNTEGAWFCTDSEDESGDGCIACNVCYGDAPEFFSEDEEGYAYVKKQPETPEDVAICQEQLDACPVGSINMAK